MSTGRGRGGGRAQCSAPAPRSLLSFEGPRAEVLRSRASAKLENCTKAKRVLAPFVPSGAAAHSADRADVARTELTVKMLRAHGGCLGTRSRGRTRTAAISRGEALNSL